MIVNFQNEQWQEESTRNTNNKKTSQPVWWTRQTTGQQDIHNLIVIEDKVSLMRVH